MTRNAIMALAALALLAGCGKKVILRPAEGRALPRKAATAAAQPSVEQLLDPSVQARPSRDSELISKSKPLAPDRFDLPPPG